MTAAPRFMISRVMAPMPEVKGVDVHLIVLYTI